MSKTTLLNVALRTRALLPPTKTLVLEGVVGSCCGANPLPVIVTVWPPQMEPAYMLTDETETAYATRSQH